MTSSSDTNMRFTLARHIFKDYVTQQCKILQVNLTQHQHAKTDEKCAKLLDQISLYERDNKLLVDENIAMRNKLAVLDSSHRTDDTIRTMTFISTNGSTPKTRLSSFANLTVDKTMTPDTASRDKTKFECNACRKVFDYEINLQWHLDNNCFQSPKTPPAIANQAAPRTNCSASNAERHMQIGNNDRSVFVCKEHNCGESFHFRQHFDVHMRIHSGDVFVCKYSNCGSLYTNKLDLIRHIRVHVHKKPFVCKMPDCEKCQRKQSNELTLSCKQPNCKLNFAEKSELVQHVKDEHAGEREEMFVCGQPTCGKKFASKDKAMAHQWIHNQRVPIRVQKK